jgi:hypothetical protein
VLDTVIPIFLIGMDDDLGIGLGFEVVPACFELGAYGLEVVDLPVINDPDISIFIRDRLVAGEARGS